MAATVSGLAAGAADAATPVADVFLDLDNIRKWDECCGDTWDPFWADDDCTYAFNCDGRGFGTKPRNLAFNKLSGDAAHLLAGSLVNGMDEYGVANRKEADGATWKALGQECIDGVFYAFVSRHTYGHESGDPLLRQTAVNASLIKSADRGLTWVRSAAENYRDPMWPGRAFGAPFFVHCGKDGGRVARDGADRYVYATSTDGFWNCGDRHVLGRVERRRLAALDASDWTYYTGGDGMDPASWSRSADEAAPVLDLPGRCGSGPATYVPSLGVYVMIAWYIPVRLARWFEPAEVRYDFYQAEHPWGPWRFVRSHSDSFITGGHMYGPSLCARFQERVGTDVKMVLFTSGCPFPDAPGSLYKMWEIPVVLRTAPAPESRIVNDDDAGIAYVGSWQHSPGRPFGDHKGDVHHTTVPGDSAEYAFTGTGIDYVSEKNADHGKVDVYLDGVLRKKVDLGLVNFPRIAQVVVFSATGLAEGRHTIRIVNGSGKYAIVDAFRVYGGR